MSGELHVRRWVECWTASDGELVGSGETEQEARADLARQRDLSAHRQISPTTGNHYCATKLVRGEEG